MDIKSFDPTTSPTIAPTEKPSSSPTNAPTLTVSSNPSMRPVFGPVPETKAPTRSPSKVPSPPPTSVPVPGVTASPTETASKSPTQNPTTSPTKAPTKLPTPGITPDPTITPSIMPSLSPTIRPSNEPSSAPSVYPSASPSSAPTSKRTRLEAILSRFAPFDGDKGLALDWLATDTWEPPIDAVDETPLWEERFALTVFFYATNGDGDTWFTTTGWLTSASVCTWNGILACDGDGFVTRFELTRNVPGSGLSFRSFGLTGDFPDELRALRNLEHFDFYYNKDMRGPIPSFLTTLTKLTYLGLTDTGRTGSIPSELWTLTQLTALRLYGNYLTGSIPSGISTMTDLSLLYLSWNDLTGSLPDDAGGMTQLTDFIRIHENFFTGAVPPLPSTITICRLAHEIQNHMPFSDRKREGNCFTDTTNAPSVCFLGANQCWLEATLSRFAPFDGNRRLALDWLKADTWTPPSTAANKKALWEERFALVVFYYATGGDGWSNNAGWLTSADVCTWTGILACNGDGSVTDIRLEIAGGGNYGLVGDFPDEMRALTNLEWLSFAYNRNLSGTIPSFLTALTKLIALTIGDTGRTGSIPAELWTLTQLISVNLFGNYLTGTIPPGIGSLSQLVNFQVLSNDLTGSLPDEFGGLTKLTKLYVHENYLTGTIPPLPSSLTGCPLAYEDPCGVHYNLRKTEGNCFTDTTNAPGRCNLSANCR